MLTIFAIPKAFKGKFKVIQLNAIQSWLNLRNKRNVEIILLGNEKGVEEVCRKYSLVYIPAILKNSHGTPLLDDCFKKAIKKAKFKIITYVNSDIILLSDFLLTINQIKSSEFLLTGRRYNLTIDKQLKFDDRWENKLKKRIREESQLYKFGALDYFVFPKNLNLGMPPFAVGRTAWDNWLVYETRSMQIPVIDGSSGITAIHQEHDYSHAKGFNKEKEYNWKLVGDRRKFFNIKDANWIVTKKGVKETPLNIIRSVEKFPVLNNRIGFLAEPFIFLIRIFKYLIK